MKRSIFFITAIIVLFPSVLFSQDQAGIEVINIVVCTSVEDRQPVGADSAFSPDVGQLYCFTKLTSRSYTSTVSHVWFYGDMQMAKVDLPINAQTWRTWSSKKILPEWTGDWRVEVQDSSGNVISNTAFIVK